jgi:ParB family chromosome partitioning protein
VITIRPTSPSRGVFVSIDADGSLSIDRGYVRPRTKRPEPKETIEPEDRRGDPAAPNRRPAVQRAVITIGGQPAEPEEDDEDDASSRCPNASSSS